MNDGVIIGKTYKSCEYTKTAPEQWDKANGQVKEEI